GMGSADRKLTLIQITDGTSNTLLVGEKSVPQSRYNDTNGANWDEGIWIGSYGGTGRSGTTVVQDPPTSTLGNVWVGPFPGGCLFVMCDGSVRTIAYGFPQMFDAMT